MIKLKLAYSFFFFYLGFLSQPFTNHNTAGQEGGHLFNTSLLLTPVSQTLRHYASDYCREITSVHRYKLHPNQEPLASERKSLATRLRTLTLTPILSLEKKVRFSAYLNAFLLFKLSHFLKILNLFLISFYENKHFLRPLSSKTFV